MIGAIIPGVHPIRLSDRVMADPAEPIPPSRADWHALAAEWAFMVKDVVESPYSIPMATMKSTTLPMADVIGCTTPYSH